MNLRRSIFVALCLVLASPALGQSLPGPPRSGRLEYLDRPTMTEVMARAVFHWNHGLLADLLRAGGDPNGDVSPGIPLLAWAASNGDAITVKALLKAGAEVDRPDNQDATPLSWAASNGNLQVMRLLLTHGADPNRMEYRGLTPLMRATWNDHPGAIRLLLQFGADADLKNAHGEDVSYYALRSGDADIIRLIDQIQQVQKIGR